MASQIERRRGSGEWIHGAVNDIQDFAAFLGRLWVLVGWVFVIPLAIWNHEAVGKWLIGVFA